MGLVSSVSTRCRSINDEFTSESIFFFHISLGGASPGERQGRDRVSKRVKEEEEEEGEEAVRGIDRFPRGLGQLKDSNGR